MRNSRYLVLLMFLVLTALAAAQDRSLTLATSTSVPTVDGVVGAGEYGAVLELTRVSISMSRSADTLSIAIGATTRGWVAIGLGSNRMDGATIFMGYVGNDGKLQLKPQRGSGHTHADVTTDALIASAGKEANGRTTIELRLKASSFIAKDQKELIGIVATGNGDSFVSMHSFRSTWTAKLSD